MSAATPRELGSATDSYSDAPGHNLSGVASLVFPGEEPHALVTKPDVVAPGVQVLSCIPPELRPDGEYDSVYMDGTSMATPHVSGVVALLMSEKPMARATEIVKAIKDTAKHPNGADAPPDNRWGHGVVDPSRSRSCSCSAGLSRGSIQ